MYDGNGALVGPNELAHLLNRYTIVTIYLTFLQHYIGKGIGKALILDPIKMLLKFTPLVKSHDINRHL